MAEEADSEVNAVAAPQITEEEIDPVTNGNNGDYNALPEDVISISICKETKKWPTAVMPVEKNDDFYNMDHKRRGTAVILNHEHFANEELWRKGTNVDRDNLIKTLTRLGFDVQDHNDLRVQQIVGVIDTVSQQDHSDSDCLIVACLSHGEQGVLHASDAPYRLDWLWSPFVAEKCPSLAGKPKLFFIQACQGQQFDDGVTLLRSQVDSSPSYRLPAHPDFLIAQSTIPGFFSWRNTGRGSWFIEALCKELNTYAFTIDILAVFTIVNKTVALEFESYVPSKPEKHAKKQIPCISFMLTRMLKFKKKESNDNL